MKVGLILAAMSLVAMSCTSTSEWMDVHVAGHPFGTDLGCRRTKPLGTFDPVCDHPRLGYRGGGDPSIPVHSSARGGFGL